MIPIGAFGPGYTFRQAPEPSVSGPHRPSDSSLRKRAKRALLFLDHSRSGRATPGERPAKRPRARTFESRVEVHLGTTRSSNDTSYRPSSGQTGSAASTGPADSAYASLQSSPTSILSRRIREECPVLPRFSWQTPKPSGASLNTCKRHIPIQIPSWVETGVLKQPEPPSPALSGLSLFPIPPCGPVKQAIDSAPKLQPAIELVKLLKVYPDCPLKPSRQTQDTTFLMASSAAQTGTRGLQDNTLGPQLQLETTDKAPDESQLLKSPVLSGTQTAGLASAIENPAQSLTGLVCNVHRTTGDVPPGLVGASTTIVGDKLYVFGGRRLSQKQPHLTRHLYELDLIRRHWTRIEYRGSSPSPRYFHSMCGVGDTKLICYGGMAPTPKPSETSDGRSSSDPGIMVMSDIHVYDIPSQTWSAIAASNPPPGRYAHCAAVLPSSGVFTSASAPLSAIHHNPAESNPNKGSIGVAIDGRGGAELVIVGGQDSASRYIEQISVFNLRSLNWTTSSPLGKSCGAYRSVAAPLTGHHANLFRHRKEKSSSDRHERHEGFPMLIYSNYNFLDVKLDLQIRAPDGHLHEKTMHHSSRPPGLRFPDGGIINNHFLVSGTFLTSSKQEYALWALNLKSLSWSRIDIGSGILSNGSWNRGAMWHRRNTYVVLGDRTRNLGDDYSHRRLNFKNMCAVELEAFGLYENPASALIKPRDSQMGITSQGPMYAPTAADRAYLDAVESLGRAAMGPREVADMDILAVGGERIPVNSRIVGKRWGPYFLQVLNESEDRQDATLNDATQNPPAASNASQASSMTVTPSMQTTTSTATTVVPIVDKSKKPPSSGGNSDLRPSNDSTITRGPQSRVMYLPHTYFTIRALVHYLYTSSLPQISSPFCTPQILCSLLQIARPYQINGLTEAVVERLHQVLDGRNTPAIFNAAAMAAGGGSAVGAVGGYTELSRPDTIDGIGGKTASENAPESSATSSTSFSDSDSSHGKKPHDLDDQEIWTGEPSPVIGLQKRGLRGLMESKQVRSQVRPGETTAVAALESMPLPSAPPSAKPG